VNDDAVSFKTKPQKLALIDGYDLAFIFVNDEFQALFEKTCDTRFHKFVHQKN